MSPWRGGEGVEKVISISEKDKGKEQVRVHYP